MKERFLPIGTIVKLKGGQKPLMITSFCIFPNTSSSKEGNTEAPKNKLYEYGACTYPEGIIDSNLACAFNHEQIEEILHLGYETEQHQQISKVLNDGYETFKQAYESGALN